MSAFPSPRQYHVTLTFTQRKAIEIEATSLEDARDKACAMYSKAEAELKAERRSQPACACPALKFGYLKEEPELSEIFVETILSDRFLGDPARTYWPHQAAWPDES